VQYIIHDLFHILGFSPQLYGFYRDSKGAPLTPRDHVTGLPPMKGNLFSWSNKVITFKQITDWEIYNGKVNHDIAYMVTPKVKAAVQTHFKCFSNQFQGAPMELQKWPYYHWENRLFHGEILGGESGKYLVISTITLAGLEDTGWYTADYSYAQKYTWGKGLGCDFATKSCLGFMKSQKTNGQPVDPFCEKKSTLSQVSCSSDRRAIVKCNLVNHTRSIPREYQYFTGTSGFTDRSGGKDVLVDFCPYYQEFSLNQEKDSRCYIESNQPTNNIALETYGSSSVCLNHGGRKWTKDGKATSLTMAGAGCYKVRMGPWL
jgi:leishmanolysin-like peptidase